MSLLHFTVAPVITWVEEINSLVCYLNDTGGYKNLWVSFTRENAGRNTTVGHCHRDSTQEYRGMVISFNRTLNACVLQLPRPLQQQDSGKYSCSLLISKFDAEVAIESQGTVTVKGKKTQSAAPTLFANVLVSIIIGVIFLLLIIVTAILSTACFWRKHGKRQEQNLIYFFSCRIS